MSDLGILGPEERLELLDGEILEMAAIGSRNFACVNMFTRWFVRGVGDRAIVSIQNPVRISPQSEPEPDLALLHPRVDDYASSLPGPSDVFLLIEVADTSLDYDRRKLLRYAAAGIPEVWIAELEGKCMLVHREPSADGYGNVKTVTSGTLSPLAFPDLELQVDRFLRPGTNV